MPAPAKDAQEYVQSLAKTNTTKLPVTALRKSDACVEH